MRVLFLGDIVGNLGVDMVNQYLPKLKHDLKPQVTIVNGENSTPVGRGINYKVYKQLMNDGADVITLGNHAWNNEEIYDFIDDSKNLVRPLNYPGKDVPGSGYTVINVNGKKLAVINLQGRIFIDPIDDPFQKIDELLNKIEKEVDYVFVDFHAETTSEKKAMGIFLTGRASAVVGTHTHVQTNDNQILNNQTAYITDVGMCGPFNSVLGMKYDSIIHRFLTQRPTRFEVQNEGDQILSGCLIDLRDDGTARSIKTILIDPSHPYNR